MTQLCVCEVGGGMFLCVRERGAIESIAIFAVLFSLMFAESQGQL